MEEEELKSIIFIKESYFEILTRIYVILYLMLKYFYFSYFG